MHRVLTGLSLTLFLAGLGAPIIWVTFRFPPGSLIVLVVVLWGAALIAEKLGKEENEDNSSDGPPHPHP